MPAVIFGSEMGKFNKLKVNFRKKKELKVRVTKKLVGSKKKHEAASKNCSGKRTKKHQRRMAHKEKVSLQDAVAVAVADDDVEMRGPSKSRQKKAATTKMQE